MATNLEFIKSASGTSVSSLSVTDCFSDKYDVYFCEIAKVDVTASNFLVFRFIDSGGSVISASEYDYAQINLRSYSSFSESRATASTGFALMPYVTPNAEDGYGFASYIFNPYDSSSYSFVTQQGTSFINGSGLFGTKQIGVHKVAEQLSGVNVSHPSGNFDNITINLFGVK